MDWSGRALGGTGNAVTVRAAVAWSQVPQVCLSSRDVANPARRRGLAGLRPNFGSPIPAMPPRAAAANPFALTRGVESIISIWSFISVWSFVLMLHCVGEVHRFSAWRALAAFLLPGALFIGISIVVKVAMT